jgi:chromate transporter
VIVTQRRWLSEREFAEMYGVAQALPGATAINIAVMLSDRLAGPLGPLAALTGLILPSLLVAIALVGIATQLSAANARFAAAETAVTAAVAGIFISNGIRLGAQIWSATPDLRVAWRCARLAIGALGVTLVAGLHLFVPFAMVILVAASMFVETRLRAIASGPQP